MQPSLKIVRLFTNHVSKPMNSFLVAVHIAAGTIAILSGLLSFFPKKGSSGHMFFGLIFFYCMLVMAGIASILAAFYSGEPINFIIGLFTSYLVFTARNTIRNRSGKVLLIEKITSAIAFVLFSGFVYLLYNAIQSGKEIIDGVYIQAFYVFTVLSFLAFILDVKVIFTKGIKGKQRIVRHLWRMSLALFIATTSVVYGQPQVFPEIINSSGLLDVVVLLIVVSLIFWILKVYLGRRFSVRS